MGKEKMAVKKYELSKAAYGGAPGKEYVPYIPTTEAMPELTDTPSLSASFLRSSLPLQIHTWASRSALRSQPAYPAQFWQQAF